MIRILLAGQGGQGVLSAGKIIAESGLHEGKEVSYLPAYGPEMRGGTANCSVIVSDEEIASPLCNEPDVLVAMNAPSFHKFAPRVKKGGVILVNVSLSDDHAGRDDVSLYEIAANDIAMEEGDVRSANSVMLGALCGVTGLIQDRSVVPCLQEKFIGKPKVLEINEKAFAAGKAAVAKKK